MVTRRTGRWQCVQCVQCIVVYLVVRWKGGQELKQGVCGRPTEWRERERWGEGEDRREED